MGRTLSMVLLSPRCPLDVRPSISIVTIQNDAEYSTGTTQLSAYMKNNSKTTIQVDAQQPFIQVVTWENFYLRREVRK